VIAIATDGIETIIGRLTQDKSFRVKYCQDPDATLKSYLSPEEIRAIKTGDGHDLSRMGCDRWQELFASLCSEVPAD
jgi:hypothetical protein